jgi:5,10-methylenetetrahydromethanopterin reductase
MSKPAIGVIFHPQFPPESLVDYARRAESAGFDELWLWEDSFLAGALTSAALVLAGTERLKVGIGIMPATVRNPLFVAMEITTLARLFPGRFLPGFGHGSAGWMKQIGAVPKSTMKALEGMCSDGRERDVLIKGC